MINSPTGFARSESLTLTGFKPMASTPMTRHPRSMTHRAPDHSRILDRTQARHQSNYLCSECRKTMIGHFHECIREPDPLWEVILQPQYLRNLLTLDQSLDRDRVMLRPRLRYLILFLSLGLVASYVSVNVLTSYGYLPSGIAIMNYGFPLPWLGDSERNPLHPKPSSAT